jgi:hypothetical protein
LINNEIYDVAYRDDDQDENAGKGLGVKEV